MVGGPLLNFKTKHYAKQNQREENELHKRALYLVIKMPVILIRSRFAGKTVEQKHIAKVSSVLKNQ